MEQTEYEIDLKEIFYMLKQRWMMITGITIGAAVIAAIISFFFLTPIYQASTTMIVSYKQSQESVMTYNDLQTSQKLVATYSEIVKSERIADEVIDTLKLDTTATEFNSKISVSQVGSTEILKISITDADPELAALMVNTVSTVFQKEINEMMEVENVSTIDVAKVPTSPIKPNKVMNVAIAGAIGLMASVGLVFVLEFLDRTYKTPSDIERHLGLPIIGAIPDMDIEQKR